MKLSVKERAELLNILPADGNIVTLRVVQDLRTGLALGPGERELIGLKPGVGGQVTWDETKDPMKDVAVTEPARSLVVRVLTDLEKAEKLRLDHLSLYGKFVETPCQATPEPPTLAT